MGPGKLDQILTAARNTPNELGIHPEYHVPHNIRQALPPYELEPLPRQAIDDGSGLSVMQEIPCGVASLATPYLREMQASPEERNAVIIATVKCLAHANAVTASKQTDPVGVLDCNTLVAMDSAGRVLLFETMGKRDPDDDWPRGHFWNRSYQPPDGWECPKEAVVGHLATMIGDQRVVVGWRPGFDLASLGLAISRVMAIDLSRDPLVRDFFAEISRDSGAPEEEKVFVQAKLARPLPITKACSLFTPTKVNVPQGPLPQRDVLRDAYFVAAIWRLLGEQIVQRRRRPEWH